jgi:peroxiredoxin
MKLDNSDQPLKMPSVGEIAPLFSLPATDGSLISLEDYPKPVALVFMRHLA